MAKKQIADFDTTISGIPCCIKVDRYLSVPPFRGPAHLAPSDLDYYGYKEFEFTVLDRRGYVADWLSNKLTSSDFERIQKEYETILEDRHNEY